MTLAKGQTLASYEVLSLIGRGGMGEVYLACDTRLGREVALKLLPDEVAGTPRLRARFESEAQMLAALNHPNIASLHGLEEGGRTVVSGDGACAGGGSCRAAGDAAGCLCRRRSRSRCRWRRRSRTRTSTASCTAI